MARLELKEVLKPDKASDVILCSWPRAASPAERASYHKDMLGP